MKIFFMTLTAIYGLFWLVFGLNGFLHFFPVPEPTGEAAEFMQALMKAGYVMPIVYTTQIICGIMLLSRHLVPLALLLLGPVVMNVLLYDLFLNPSGLITGVAISIFYAALLFKSRNAFLPLFNINQGEFS
jgi:hypothetical protein